MTLMVEDIELMPVDSYHSSPYQISPGENLPTPLVSLATTSQLFFSRSLAACSMLHLPKSLR